MCSRSGARPWHNLCSVQACPRPRGRYNKGVKPKMLTVGPDIICIGSCLLCACIPIKRGSLHEEQDGAPGQVAPGQVAPGQVAPGQVAPGQVAPGHVAPGHVTPGQVAPGHVAPDQVAPGQVAPGQVARGQVARGQVADAVIVVGSLVTDMERV